MRSANKQVNKQGYGLIRKRTYGIAVYECQNEKS